MPPCSRGETLGVFLKLVKEKDSVNPVARYMKHIFDAMSKNMPVVQHKGIFNDNS